MKEFKGTPGQWFADGTSVWSREVKPKKECEEGSIYVAELFSDVVDESEADAKLIAAAPAMINFIIELMDESGDSLEEKGHWSFYAMKDLIKKALGE